MLFPGAAQGLLSTQGKPDFFFLFHFYIFFTFFLFRKSQCDVESEFIKEDILTYI